jgi:hypothetical protein
MRQLPVGKAFRHVVASTRDNLGFAFQSQWPWLLILGLLLAAMYNSLGSVMGLDEAQMKAALEKDPSLAVQFVGWAVVVAGVGMLGFSSIAVNWHRFVLKDERPQGLQTMRVDAVVWRYLGNLILVTLLAALAAIPVMMVVTMLLGLFGVLVLPILIAALSAFVLPVIYRLSVKLPAVALGRRDFRLGDAWQATNGNWWQIAGLGILVTVLTWSVGLLLFGLSMALQNILGPDISAYVDVALQVAVNWALTVLGITTLTSLYGFFVEGRDF